MVPFKEQNMVYDSASTWSKYFLTKSDYFKSISIFITKSSLQVILLLPYSNSIFLSPGPYWRHSKYICEPNKPDFLLSWSTYSNKRKTENKQYAWQVITFWGYIEWEWVLWENAELGKGTGEGRCWGVNEN